MTRSRSKLIPLFVLIIEVLALILVSTGLYMGFSGTGNTNEVGYIYIGSGLAVAGGLLILLFFRQKAKSQRNTNKR